LLSANGGHDNAFSNQEEKGDYDDDDDIDEMDGEDDDGANKMLSNVSVRRSRITFQPHSASHFISSLVHIIDSSIRGEVNRHLLQSEITEQVMDDSRQYCLNKDANCAFWALTDKCTKNNAFMVVNCPLTCQMCSFILMFQR
jgi:hypothetical protein